MKFKGEPMYKKIELIKSKLDEYLFNDFEMEKKKFQKDIKNLYKQVINCLKYVENEVFAKLNVDYNIELKIFTTDNFRIVCRRVPEMDPLHIQYLCLCNNIDFLEIFEIEYEKIGKEFLPLCMHEVKNKNLIEIVLNVSKRENDFFMDIEATLRGDIVVALLSGEINNKICNISCAFKYDYTIKLINDKKIIPRLSKLIKFAIRKNKNEKILKKD
jgi:hypothetical protein